MEVEVAKNVSSSKLVNWLLYLACLACRVDESVG